MSHYRDLADGWATNRGGGPAPKTYADYLAHVTAAYPSLVAWDQSYTPEGFHRTVAGAGAGGLYGSTWGNVFGQASVVCRMMQHGLPSAEEFGRQQVAGRVMVFQKRYWGEAEDGVYGQGRNGFNSQTEGVAQSVFMCEFLLYWDEVLGQAMQMNPRNATGPTLYAAPGW